MPCRTDQCWPRCDHCTQNHDPEHRCLSQTDGRCQRTRLKIHIQIHVAVRLLDRCRMNRRNLGIVSVGVLCFVLDDSGTVNFVFTQIAALRHQVQCTGCYRYNPELGMHLQCTSTDIYRP
jgi:hypothetical protein